MDFCESICGSSQGAELNTSQSFMEDIGRILWFNLFETNGEEVRRSMVIVWAVLRAFAL